MGRSKVKYRDVVKKEKTSNNKKTKKGFRTRKTYSLYKNDNKKKQTKRRYDEELEIDNKRPKVEEKTTVESSSESEVEYENHLKQLRESFGVDLNPKKSLAIDSSDDEDDVEEEENNSEDFEDEESTEEEEDINEFSEKLKDVEESAEALENLDEENEIDAETAKEEETNADSNDPFIKHICYDLHESLLNSLQSTPMDMNRTNENWPILGKLHIQIPKCDQITEEEQSFSIVEKKIYAPAGVIPQNINIKSTKPQEMFIKTQIIDHLRRSNKSLYNNDLFTPLQGELFSIINNYQDLFFPGRHFDNAEEIRFIYCLHAVNHVLKTRIKVLHHNARLSKKFEVPEEFRDQGLVRPKVLIIVPFRDAAYKIIKMLIDLVLPEDKGNVMNKSRFIEDFTGNELILPKKNPKPEDYEKLFCGNTGDDFKIGITVTKKSLKLYADFYSADIIIASPLGLRTVVGAEGETDRDYDFLASIELLVFDQTDVFLMQNWDHVLHILKHLHLQPKEAHGTDFSRVRTWSLNGWSKYYRQTLIFSSLILPEINSIFNKMCFNYAGKASVVNPIEFGKIGQVFVQLPHVFHKFEARNVLEAIELRFEFFIKKILPQQRDNLMKQTLIFVPNYFDYVKLRNYFKREDIPFVQICEYSKDGKIARARDMFYHGDAQFLLYTERYHFFNRIRIKGIRHIVFYQLPNIPHFYYELCNLMQEINMNKKIGSMSNMTVNVIYSKYDVHQLAQIVGTEKAGKMLQSDRNVHMLVTGSE